MLLDHGHKMSGRIPPREDHRLSAESADFGPAEIENVTSLGEVLYRQVAAIPRKPVGKPGSIDKKRDVGFAANLVDPIEFLFGINSAILRWE